MAKYAIVKTTRVASGHVRWEAHRYGLSFKIFGPHIGSEVIGADTSESADECERILVEILKNMGKTRKYEIVRIVEH